MDYIYGKGKGMEQKLVMWLQEFGLLLPTMSCPSALPDCQMTCKPARVVDRYIFL